MGKLTKNKVKKYFNKLLTEQKKEMKKDFEKALNSDAVELSNFGDDFTLPKILIYACNKRMLDQWRPLMPENRKDAENIYLHI